MMRSATAFLPPSMITFMNLDSSTLPNLGSGRISRLGTSLRRGIFYLYLCFSWHLFSHRESQSRTPTYSTRAEHLRLGPLRCLTAPRGIQHRKFLCESAGLTWPWASWHRTWSATACGLSRLASRANHAQCGNAHRASP